MYAQSPLDTQTLVTDYLVVGAGATALSFVDTILADTNATLIVVDRHAHPGGHWNDAYPFVRLHQPTVWYGVPSRRIPEDSAADEYGRGATAEEILAYFDRLMHERFVPSGRVQWIPRAEYVRTRNGVHQLRSVESGHEFTITARRKLVNATLTQTEIPSTHPPMYAIAPGVHIATPNALPTQVGRYERFTVIGGGKTAMDTCLFLLDRGVAPSAIRWIIPRDSWLMDRSHMLPGAEHFVDSLRGFIAHYEAIAESTSLDDLFLQLERRGVLHRLDPGVRPGKIRGAVSSSREMDRLRMITDVVRRGRVQDIGERRVTLERGTIDVRRSELFIDCSASAAITPHDRPVFERDVIRLLMIVWGQPMLSASLIAHVEATVSDDAEKNALCEPVVSPQTVHDWLPMWAATIRNAGRWRGNTQLHAWIRRNRLHVPTMMTQGVPPDHPALQSLMKELGAKLAAAANRLQGL